MSGSAPDPGRPTLSGQALVQDLSDRWRTLPVATLLALAMGGLRVRLMRSVVTMGSVILAIAFLSYTGLTNKLTFRLANIVQTLEDRGPRVPVSKVAPAAQRLAGADLGGPLDPPELRALAMDLKLHEVGAEEDELTSLPALERDARADLAKAQESLEGIEADPEALPSDRTDARAAAQDARRKVDEFVARRRALQERVDLGQWIRSPDSARAPAMGPALRAAVETRQEELFRTPLSRLDDGELEQVARLASLAEDARADAQAQEASKLYRSALADEGEKRQSRDLRMRMRQAGVNIDVTLAGNPLDTWLILMALLTCAVGIANAMLMSVTERFREIATMKCLGAQDSLVIKLFLLESGFLGGVGALLGIPLGFAVALMAALIQYRGHAVENLPLGELWPIVGWSLLAGVFLAVFGAVGPAFSASRMRPVDALRVDE